MFTKRVPEYNKKYSAVVRPWQIKHPRLLHISIICWQLHYNSVTLNLRTTLNIMFTTNKIVLQVFVTETNNYSSITYCRQIMTPDSYRLQIITTSTSTFIPVMPANIIWSCTISFFVLNFISPCSIG